jgi:hypothetical protein
MFSIHHFARKLPGLSQIVAPRAAVYLKFFDEFVITDMLIIHVTRLNK